MKTAAQKLAGAPIAMNSCKFKVYISAFIVVFFRA
jgi:hypothetical protein